MPRDHVKITKKIPRLLLKSCTVVICMLRKKPLHTKQLPYSQNRVRALVESILINEAEDPIYYRRRRKARQIKPVH